MYDLETGEEVRELDERPQQPEENEDAERTISRLLLTGRF